jgi:hypothetical protein
VRRLLLSLVILAIAFIWAPQVLESATSSCAALEQKTVTQETGGSELGSSLVQKLSGGTLAEQAMKDRYPNLPTLVSCSLEYWKKTVGLKE